MIKGQVVTSLVKTFVCGIDEPGVCVDVYNIGGQTGYMILFENGDTCGYSQEEVDTMLVVYDHIDKAAVSYNYTSELQISEDFHNGVFKNSFNHVV